MLPVLSSTPEKHQDIAKLRIVATRARLYLACDIGGNCQIIRFHAPLEAEGKLPVQFSRVEKHAPPTICYHHNSCIAHTNSQYHATCVAMGVGAVVHTLRCCQYDRLDGMATLVTLRSESKHTNAYIHKLLSHLSAPSTWCAVPPSGLVSFAPPGRPAPEGTSSHTLMSLVNTQSSSFW